MKKRWVKMALVLGCLLALSAWAAAQSPVGAGEESSVPILAKLKLLQLSDAQVAKLKGVKTTTKPVDGQVLQSLEIVTMSDSPALVHIGEKWPIVYYDPRAEQFQIQYVDIGGKFDVTFRLVGVDTFSVEARPEISTLHTLKVFGDVKRLEAYPRTSVVLDELTYPSLKFGETLVMSTIRGATARTFLESLGRPVAQANLVYVVELSRP